VEKLGVGGPVLLAATATLFQLAINHAKHPAFNADGQKPFIKLGFNDHQFLAHGFKS
jgi:hypothetical protein